MQPIFFYSPVLGSLVIVSFSKPISDTFAKVIT